jgi:hypothetical protein
MLPPDPSGEPVVPRTQPDQPKPLFKKHLALEALRVKEQIKSLPQGRKRELLARKARELEIALHVDKWLSSSGLKSPD